MVERPVAAIYDQEYDYLFQLVVAGWNVEVKGCTGEINSEGAEQMMHAK
jgi:hypothetical protein